MIPNQIEIWMSMLIMITTLFGNHAKVKNQLVVMILGYTKPLEQFFHGE
jgi:hypothetical protein